MFIDESGFLLIANLKRTWAPRGKTPHFRHYYSRDKISTINAITVSPKRQHLSLYIQLHSKNITGVEVEAFLKELFKNLRGHVVILWDRGTIHKRRIVKAFFIKHPRVHEKFFPSYAPELNPAEYVWNQMDSALSNNAPKDIPELRQKLRASIRKIQGSQQLLRSCIYASDLPWDR